MAYVVGIEQPVVIFHPEITSPLNYAAILQLEVSGVPCRGKAALMVVLQKVQLLQMAISVSKQLELGNPRKSLSTSKSPFLLEKNSFVQCDTDTQGRSTPPCRGEGSGTPYSPPPRAQEGGQGISDHPPG